MKEQNPTANLVVVVITGNYNDLEKAINHLFKTHQYFEMTTLQTEKIGLINACIQTPDDFKIQHGVKKLAKKAIQQEIKRKLTDECARLGLVKPPKELKKQMTESVMQHHLANAPIEYNTYRCRTNHTLRGITHLYIPAPHNVAMKILAYLRKAETFYATELKCEKSISDVLKEWLSNEVCKKGFTFDGKCKLQIDENEVMTLQNSDLELAAQQCRANDDATVLNLQLKNDTLRFTIDASKDGLVLSGIAPINKDVESDKDNDEYANHFLLRGLVGNLIDCFGGESEYAV